MKFPDGNDYELQPWCNWLAQDKEGDWWQYENEPRKVTTLKIWIPTGKYERVCITKPPKDWTQELWEVTWT